MTSKTEFDVGILSYIKITGPDAQTFLQGQVTINLSTLSDGNIRYCAQCNAKGKLVGLGYLFHTNGDYYFIQAASGIADSLAQFEKFGVFAKVEFVLPEQTSRCIATSKNTDIYKDSLFVTPALPGAEQYSLIWVQGSELTSKKDSTDNTLFATYLIQQGVPLLPHSMADQWVPQMLNVQTLNGIDFDKGCYMGQEVVARTRYLGKNKRALYTFTIDSALVDSNNINFDTPVYKQMGEHWRKSGTIVNKVCSQDKIWLSIVLPNDVTDQDIISLGDTGEILASPYPLPYVVEFEESSIKKRKRND